MMLRRKTVPRGGRRAGMRGFTLVELMITLLILGLIMTVIYRVFSTQEKFFRTQEQVAAMQENLRATVEYINQEMSWLGYKVPGISVIKAAPGEVIFKANIPDTGTTIQYVRYQFSPTLNTISRAAGANVTDVENADLTVMATDIEALAFTYYNVLNGQVVTDAADPLCAGELSSAVCAPGSPGDDASLLMIQRVKARITSRTTRPDWSYTDPAGGSNPNYRKRSAVLDLRARNVEDVTLHGGQIGLGSCGYLTHTIGIPQNPYVACPDKLSQISAGTPDLVFTDNPSVTIQAFDMNGNLNTNPSRIVYVYAVGTDLTPFNIYDSADPYAVDNTIDNGETRYVAAQELSGVAAGNKIQIQFAYSDGICTQQLYDGSVDVLIAPSAATHFITTGDYVNNGLYMEYINLDTGLDLGLPSPEQVAMCSTVSRQGINLRTLVADDCDSGITGETVTWDDGGYGGSFINQSDDGNGTYSATYIPPGTISPPAATYTVPISALWSASSATNDITLIAAAPHDIIIDSIVDVTQAGIFQFSSTVPDRASQLGGSSGSSFQIERVDGQEILVRFHIEDACGNRVFNESPIVVNNSTTFPTTPVVHSGGSYSFVWEWGGGCGGEKTGENITITIPNIANPSTKNELITFDLLETRSSDPNAGPFLLMDQEPLGVSLQAGNTSDSVFIKATVTQYHPELGYCTNIPGVFPVEFTVSGDAGGNGSFIAAAPFDDTTETVNTDATGLAQVRLYSGTADWDDSLALTATANVDEAFYSGNIAVSMEESTVENTSGIYQDSSYVTKIGSDQAITTFDPGRDIYIQIFDYDENEDPLVKDSLTAPYDVEVRIQSTLTGDIEDVGLTEWSENVAQFRQPLDTRFAAASIPGDGVLQTRDGDTVTVYYEDKDNPADNEMWTVYTPGADSFRIYKVDGASEIELVNPGPLQEEIAYGDQVRPKLSLPFLAADARIELDTVQITIDSGDDIDTVTLREVGDTGILVPDWTVYTGDYITMSQTDPLDDSDILLTPTTPRYVTLVYDAAGAYTVVRKFFMRDFYPPTVVITQTPTVGPPVSGQVPFLVDVNDVANGTSWAGISRIELYVNGRFIDSKVGADLSPSQTFIWTTAIGTTPYWLDGGHTISAVAYDTSLNQATDSVGVTLDNDLLSIEFTQPAYGDSIWSTDVNIGIGVSMAAEAGTYQVVLAESGGMGAVLTSWTAVGNNIFAYLLPAASYSDGSYGLIATVIDTEGKFQTAYYDPLIFDRLPPNIVIGSPLDQPWIGISDFGIFQATVTDANGVSTTSVTGTFGGVCSSGPMPMSSGTGDNYTLVVPDPDAVCLNAQGLMWFTVDAEDVANPPNHAMQAASTMVDTVRPVLTFNVNPVVPEPFTLDSHNIDGFVRGDVTLDASVTDAYPQSGAFSGWFYNDPGPMVPPGPPDGTQFMFPPASTLNASSGIFSYAWTTTFYPDGIWKMRADVIDAAGNAASSSTVVLYLDNTPPWGNPPMPNAPTGAYEDLVYVEAWAQDNMGFLKEVQHNFIHTATGTTAFAGSIGFTAEQKVRNFQTVYVMDLSGWSDGWYDCLSTATDWAGNAFATTMTNCFEILQPANRREMDPFNPIAAKVSFSPVSTGQYEAMVVGGRLLDGSNNPVSSENIWMEVVRYTWDTVSSSYMWGPSYNQTVTTGLAGELPIVGPIPGMIFGETDMARVYYYLEATWQQLGTIRAYLNSPMDGTSSMYQAFEQPRSVVDNLDINITPSGPTHFTLSLTGDLLRNNGDPVSGAVMRIHSYHEEPPGFFNDQDFTDTTSGSGGFSFNDPALIFPYNVMVRIEFYDDRNDYLGWIEWDPTARIWRRWFW